MQELATFLGPQNRTKGRCVRFTISGNCHIFSVPNGGTGYRDRGGYLKDSNTSNVYFSSGKW